MCGRKGYFEADHIVAIEEGGSYGLDNLQSLCAEHHAIKTKEHAVRRAERRRAAKSVKVSG